MTERDTFVTVADSDQLNEGYFNGIQPAIDSLIHRKLFTDNTEYSDAGASFVNKMNFTFGALNALVTGITIKCELKQDSSNDTYLQVRLVGSNLGTLYIEQRDSSSGNTSGNVSFNPNYTTVQPAKGCLTGTTSSYVEYSLSCQEVLKLLDATTTLYLDIADNGAGTAYIDNTTVSIHYVTAFTED